MENRIILQGIRLKTITIEPETDKVTGTYELISSTDKVLATQDFNGYSSPKVPLSHPSTELLHLFLVKLKSDVQMALGLEEAKIIEKSEGGV